MEWTRGHTIGRGSTATVSLATRRHTGQTFAVKSAEFGRSEFLQREQGILSSLSHPHVVSYEGAEVTRRGNGKGLDYNLMMEYVPGGTLLDLIRRRGTPLEEPEIRCYARHIAGALEYLHSVGLVHCDVKGSNILVGEGGAKMGDFGSAKWAVSDPISKTGGQAPSSINGTPAFMSPEVARGEEQSFPADVWALGCTVIEMATGSSPWPDADDPVSVLYRVGFSEESPAIPGFLSELGKSFLKKCLKRRPERRWTAAQLLQHPFLEGLSSLGKTVQESKLKSPTTVLEHGFWESAEDSEAVVETVSRSSSDMRAGRIPEMASFSGMPSWTGDENWVTIRSEDMGSPCLWCC